MQQATPQLPFDAEYQASLLQMLLDDTSFTKHITPYVKPEYFENEVHAWAWQYVGWYEEQYKSKPSLHAIANAGAQALPHDRAIVFNATLDAVRQTKITDAAWLQDQTVDFVRRQVFRRAHLDSQTLYNAGDTDGAYDLTRTAMDVLAQIDTGGGEVDRQWYCEEFTDRHMQRQRQSDDVAIGSGIPDLDKLMDGGLREGQLMVWLARPKAGKALENSEPVLMADNTWQPIASLQVGDHVMGGTGLPCRVTGVFPQGKKDCSRVHFTDGTSSLCSEDHLWTVYTRKRGNQSNYKVVTTAELTTSHAIPKVIVKAGKPLPAGSLDPYLLGLLIGDGALTQTSIRFHKPERDLWDAIEQVLPSGDGMTRTEHTDTITITCGGRRSTTKRLLGELGLLVTSPHKFVPKVYLRADAKTRLAVLCGLCDTDGHVDNKGRSVEFSSASRQLCEDTCELARSLGGIARIRAKVVNGTTYWLGLLRLGQPPVRSVKNLAKCKPGEAKDRRRNVAFKNYEGKHECTCISVDDPESLFITRDHIVTHNTTWLANLGAVAMRGYQRRVLHVPLEGSGAYIADRYDTIFTDEVYRNIRRGQIDSKSYAIAYQEMLSLRRRCVIRAFTENWSYSVENIWNELQTLKREYAWVPELIIVDYCDLLEARNPQGLSITENQKQAFQDLKTLANRGYRVVTASQVTRPRGKEFDEETDILKSNEIADCYAKIRIADLVGSLNQTAEERRQKMMRLHLELSRDTASGETLLVYADFEKMIIGGHNRPVPTPATMAAGYAVTSQAPTFGYTQNTLAA